jgi:nitrate/TMAO reductase-like tetraheme cytochrome c subunit
MALFEKQTTWIKENKLKAVIFGIIALAVFGFLNLELLHFSSSPPFCKGACHTMVAEVEDWEVSSHGQREVDCVGCHYREGAVNYMVHKILAMKDLINTFTGNMGRAVDEEEHYGSEHHLEFISEEQAQEEKLMDDIALPQYIHYPEKDKGAGPSNFADENGRWRIQMHRYGFLWRVVDENCRNCHSSRGSRGRVSSKKVADFVVQDALFDYKTKAKETKDLKIGGRRPLGGSEAPHAFHTDRGIACIDCHQEIVHGSKELKEEHYERSGRRGPTGVVWPRMIICFRCHNDKRAPKDCLLCHEYQKNMNLGLQGRGVDQVAGYMYPDETDCIDCHLEENDYKMNPQVCVDCHDDEDMRDALADWQSATVSALADLETELKKIETAISEARKVGRDVTGAEDLFREAYHNYQMVWYDGSKGAHNVDYAEALLSVSQEKLKLAAEMLLVY